MKRTQCTFRIKIPGGYKQTTAWIDSTAAKVGNRVELLFGDAELWEVVSVGASSDKDHSRDHKTFKNNI